MTGQQAARSDNADRVKYAKNVLDRTFVVRGRRWYADNTREPIRDETLRDGLVAVGAVVAREDLPTTSGKPRYALKADFAKLFDPTVDGTALEDAIAAFQRKHLSKSALPAPPSYSLDWSGAELDRLLHSRMEKRESSLQGRVQLSPRR